MPRQEDRTRHTVRKGKGKKENGALAAGVSFLYDMKGEKGDKSRYRCGGGNFSYILSTV